MTTDKAPERVAKVKPLVWTGNPENSYPTWWAYGLAFSAKIDKGAASMYGDYPLFINKFWDQKKHKTLEAAKAAAQADYEQRILSALAPAAPSPDVLDVYAQGVAHARAVVSEHIDWNPSTIRNDLLLNIDMNCTGYVSAEALARITDTCPACEGYGCVATNRNDMDGFPIEVACPECTDTGGRKDG